MNPYSNPEQENMQKQYRQEALEQGAAFEEMIRSKGWKTVEGYISQQIKEFGNTALLGKGFTTVEDYKEFKGKINALQEMLEWVHSCIRLLEDERLSRGQTTKEREPSVF